MSTTEEKLKSMKKELESMKKAMATLEKKIELTEEKLSLEQNIATSNSKFQAQQKALLGEMENICSGNPEITDLFKDIYKMPSESF